DAEVLQEAALGGQIAHGLTEEIPVGPHDAPGDIDAADRRCRVDSSLAIHVEVDATAQQVVVHTRRVSNARVDDRFARGSPPAEPREFMPPGCRRAVPARRRGRTAGTTPTQGRRPRGGGAWGD